MGDKLEAEAGAQWPRWTQKQRYSYLLGQYYQPLLGYLGHWFPLLEDREDCLQEIFTTLYRKFHLYDPRRPLTPWVYTLARNQALSLLRKKGRIKEVRLEPQELSVLAVAPQDSLDFRLAWEGVLGETQPPAKRAGPPALQLGSAFRGDRECIRYPPGHSEVQVA
jgi:DNA-directed RNA polymerase specialized sigma24 family protein